MRLSEFSQFWFRYSLRGHVMTLEYDFSLFFVNRLPFIRLPMCKINVELCRYSRVRFVTNGHTRGMCDSDITALRLWAASASNWPKTGDVDGQPFVTMVLDEVDDSWAGPPADEVCLVENGISVDVDVEELLTAVTTVSKANSLTSDCNNAG